MLLFSLVFWKFLRFNSLNTFKTNSIIMPEPERKEERSRDQIIADAQKYLEIHNVMTMATASLNGEPDASALEYASDGLNTYVSTRPTSKKVQFINQNPKVFYEVHDTTKIDLDSILNMQALQVSASAEIIQPSNSRFNNAFDIMLKKFPVFSKLKKESRVILLFKPKIVWFLNYREKFFHRDMVSFVE
jgi:general stress protein 26